MTGPARRPWVRPLLAVSARVAVGVVFAALGTWEWADWRSATSGDVGAVLQWLSGCLRLTLGVWLALGVLARFAGLGLCVQAGVTAVVSSCWLWAALAVCAVLVHRRGARLTADHLSAPRW